LIREALLAFKAVNFQLVIIFNLNPTSLATRVINVEGSDTCKEGDGYFGLEHIAKFLSVQNPPFA